MEKTKKGNKVPFNYAKVDVELLVTEIPDPPNMMISIQISTDTTKTIGIKISLDPPRLLLTKSGLNEVSPCLDHTPLQLPALLDQGPSLWRIHKTRKVLEVTCNGALVTTGPILFEEFERSPCVPAWSDTTSELWVGKFTNVIGKIRFVSLHPGMDVH